MKFKITTTSLSSFEAPCENAVSDDVYDLTSDKIINTHWTIEIKTLEDLLELSLKYGDIIVDAENMALEIYDDYRE